MIFNNLLGVPGHVMYMNITNALSPQENRKEPFIEPNKGNNKLLNSEQSYKGKVKTHKYINNPKKVAGLNRLMIFNNLLGVPGHRIFLIKHDIKTIIETTRSASYLDMNLKFERDVLN
jgi:hypothetical protein